MKLPLSWLRSWVELPWSDRELADRLTMLGFEVESLAAGGAGIQRRARSRDSQRRAPSAGQQAALCARSTTVAASELQIVCGASNARAGLRTALAERRRAPAGRA